MYRFLLVASDLSIEERLVTLFAEKIRGKFLFKSTPWPVASIPPINERDPDLVFLEVPLNGREAEKMVAHLLTYMHGAPLIAVCSGENDEVEIRTVQAGAQDCLVLPSLTSRTLLRTVRHGIERAAVESKLAREQQMLASLMDQLPERIYFKDLKSRFIRVNRAMGELFQVLDPNELIGKTDHDFFTLEHAQPALEDEQRIIRTGTPMLNKLEKETLPDGSIGWVLTSKLPLQTEEGVVTGTFGISHDVTQMKLLEDAVEAERRRLKVLSEELHAKNVQLEQDLTMAKGIQQALLPGDRVVFPVEAVPGMRCVAISSVYRPASAVGGDFFTILPITNRQVGIFICDIMGHGLRAALGTAIVRGLIEQSKEIAAHPTDFLTNLNRGLRAILRNIDEPLLVTAFYTVIDTATGEFTYSSAGHTGPLLGNRRSGDVEQIALENGVSRGPALALFDDARYGQRSQTLSDDEVLVLFTDGAVELIDQQGRLVGIERLLASARRHVQLEGGPLCQSLLSDLRNVCMRSEFEDDVCLVAIERR